MTAADREVLTYLPIALGSGVVGLFVYIALVKLMGWLILR